MRGRGDEGTGCSSVSGWMKVRPPAGGETTLTSEEWLQVPTEMKAGGRGPGASTQSKSK